MLDLDAMRAPTDSESGDAQHNPDVWELRHRINDLIDEVEWLQQTIGDTRREQREFAAEARRLSTQCAMERSVAEQWQAEAERLQRLVGAVDDGRPGGDTDA